jgi:hypothetical protein
MSSLAKRAATLSRALARLIGWTFAALLVAIAIWFAANRFFDAPPSALHDPFLVSPNDRIPDAENIATGLLGLTAPPKSDILVYGAKIKALYASNAPYAQITELAQGAGTLQPTIKAGQANCWLDPDWTQFEGCLPFQQAPEVLAANRELLERLNSLYGLKKYVALEIYSFSDPFLTLLRLSVAEVQLALRRGEHEAAYRKWRDLLTFVKRRNRGTDTWVGKAIGLVAMGMTLPALESLLMANPNTARVHASELYELLRPEGVAAYDPDGIVRAEFAMLREALEYLPPNAWEQDRLHWLAFYFGQKNRILNRYASLAPKYAAALRLPWFESRKQMDLLRQDHLYPSDGEFLLDPFGSLFITNYMNGQLKAREMVRQMHIVDGRLRLATLLVRYINERIPDPQVPHFLASAGPELRNPFSGEPMRWDPKDRKIYFPDPEEKCIVDAWFRLPNLSQPARLGPSTVNTGAC